jgi:Glycine cleavage H-protein
VSDLYSPLDGEVTEVNEELNDDPGLINAEPYGLGWMFRVRVADGQATGVGLLSPTEYDTLTKSALCLPGDDPRKLRLLAELAPDDEPDDADGRQRDDAADEGIDLAEAFLGLVQGPPRDVGRGHPVSDLVDRPGEVGAGALDLADKRVGREVVLCSAARLGVGLSHVRTVLARRTAPPPG